MKSTYWMLAAAGLLLLFSSGIFALLRQWVIAALIGVGALGCLAAAFNVSDGKEQ